MSITSHPLWEDLKPFIIIETYDRDGGHPNPRHRIELSIPLHHPLFLQAIAISIPCAACKSLISPFRTRNPKLRGNPSGRLYFAATCPLNVNTSCSRGLAAKYEYINVINHAQKVG
jgi:hypothetical protein